MKARVEHLQMQGGNAFRDYQLPEAALALKQGVGRLIRSEDDFGAVVICDPRLTARSYGKVFLDALPPMRVTRRADETLRFLRRHAPAPAGWGMAPAAGMLNPRARHCDAGLLDGARERGCDDHARDSDRPRPCASASCR